MSSPSVVERTAADLITPGSAAGAALDPGTTRLPTSVAAVKAGSSSFLTQAFVIAYVNDYKAWSPPVEGRLLLRDERGDRVLVVLGGSGFLHLAGLEGERFGQRVARRVPQGPAYRAVRH